MSPLKNAIGLALAFVLPAGLASAPAAGVIPERDALRETGPTVVNMTDRLTFQPETVYVAPGTEVRFENTSALAHTVTADPEKAAKNESVQLPEGAEPFDSGTMAPGNEFTHTFEVPGTYVYFCIPHEGADMTGVVVVEETGNR